MSDDYYKILGVNKTATDDDIKRAYRKLAQEHHPDRPTGNEKKFKEINEAYQVLSNKEKRAQYDRFGKTFQGAGGPGFSGGPGFEGFDFNFGDMGDISDIFETFFTGMGGKRRKTYTRGSDLQFVAEVTLEEAYHGIKKDIKFKAFEACKECSGLGYFEKEGTKNCSTCDGRGEIKEVRNSFFGAFQQVRACGKCNATGQIPNKVCGSCKGSGRIMGARALQVEILPGVADGQLIKVAGVGEVGERGAPTGDLYVQVRVAPHKTFLRERDDLVIIRPLKITDLLTARLLDIVTISGEKVSVEIPPGFDLRQRLKVAGKGMPHFGRSGRGDLYIAFEVRAPKRVSAKAKKIIEELSGEFE